jgi:hypothetical protein
MPLNDRLGLEKKKSERPGNFSFFPINFNVYV